MKHYLLHRSIALLAVVMLTLAASAQGTKKIVLKCYDTFGTYLLTDSIVQPQESCFFLIPPQIPYYSCVTYDPKGSSACLVGGELNVEYRANGLTGFDSLTQQSIEAKDNMSVVVTIMREGEPHLWTAQGSTSKMSIIPLSKAAHSPEETWVFTKSYLGWQVYNEATGLYLAGISKSGDLMVGEEPVMFAMRTSRVTGEAWEITDAQTQQTYSFVPRRYAVRPFFKLQENFVDDKDEEIVASRESYVKAGDSFKLEIKNIQDYSYKSWRIDGNDGGDAVTLPKMETHHTIEYVYKHVTAISHQRELVKELAPVDLSGRRVTSGYRGLVIVGGRVKWQ